MDLGIVPQDASRREMNSTDDWDALSPAEQQYEAKRMAVYAGMVSAMDAEIGRLQNFLAERGKLANTLFIFTSDNGAEASGAPKQDTAGNRWSLSRQGYSIDESTLGTQGSFNTISPSFASAAASPLAEYKFHAGEGGMRVPLIISGPTVQAKDGITHAFAWATDIAATILSAAGVSHPNERFAGRPILPMTGKTSCPSSLTPKRGYTRRMNSLAMNLQETARCSKATSSSFKASHLSEMGSGVYTTLPPTLVRRTI